jgi:type IV pilus assembly protein PilM
VGGLTNLALADGTTCRFTRVVGSGCEQLAVELAERRGMALDDARDALFAVGLDRVGGDGLLVDAPADVVADVHQVLADGVRRIASEVRTSVDFHRGTAADGPDEAPLRCVVTGAGSGIPGFPEALGVELGLEVEAGRFEGEVAGVDARAVTVAAGLALEEARAA